MKKLLESRWHPLRNVFEVKILWKLLNFKKNLESFKDQSICDDIEGFPHQGIAKRIEEDVIYSEEQLNLCQGWLRRKKVTDLGMSLEYKDVRAIRDLEVADYIEVIASEVVGGENVYSFFTKCF